MIARVAYDDHRRPTASVVIPARDPGDNLSHQLDALGHQDTTAAFEIVVADNGSTDGSVSRIANDPRFASRVTVVDASQARGAGHARNVGAAATTGEHLLFCDADDVVGPRWVAAHLAALESADAAYGPIREFRDAECPRTFESEWSANELALVRPFVMLPSGNLSVRRAVFESLGGFATTAGISEDMEFSVRLQRAGHGVRYAPEAKLYWRRPSTAGEEYRKQRAYSRRAAQTLAALRPVGVTGQRRSPTWRKLLWLAKHAPSALARRDRRLEWAGVAGMVRGELGAGRQR